MEKEIGKKALMKIVWTQEYHVIWTKKSFKSEEEQFSKEKKPKDCFEAS